MKILVTGSAGFIGSNLCNYLLDKDYEVIGVDDYNDYYSPKVKEYNVKDFKDHKSFSDRRVDIVDAEKLDKVFDDNKDINAVVHLAAWAGVTSSFEKPAVYVRNNLEGTVNLLESCRKHGVKNIIFASTSSIYGDAPTPFREDMSTDFPLAPYNASKKACEVMLYVYSKNFGINSTIFRFFNPCGPRMRPDLALPLLIKSCTYGTEFPQYWSEEAAKKTGRDYFYINHAFEAMEYVFNHPFTYEIFNIGNSSPVSLADTIATIEKVTGRKANIKVMPPRSGEMLMTYSDISKAKKLLGFNPVTPLSEIVKIYHDWFINQEEWYRKGEY